MFGIVCAIVVAVLLFGKQLKELLIICTLLFPLYLPFSSEHLPQKFLVFSYEFYALIILGVIVYILRNKEESQIGNLAIELAMLLVFLIIPVTAVYLLFG